MAGSFPWGLHAWTGDFPWSLKRVALKIDACPSSESVWGATRLGATGPKTSEREICLWEFSLNQKPGDHPNFRKNALRVQGPFSELSESSGVFSEQLSELVIPFSEYEIPFSEWPLTTWLTRNPQFSEQLSERFPELPRTHPKDFHLPLHSRSVFSRIGVVPVHQT